MVTTTRSPINRENSAAFDHAAKVRDKGGSLEDETTMKQNINGSAEVESHKAALDRQSSGSSVEEDYDDKIRDTAAVMQGSKGGQIEVDLYGGPPRHARRSSIPIRLEKTEKHGRYMLHADDPEIKEIIRRGLERQEVSSNNDKPQGNRIRELIFTRRFTAFDRQNPSNTESPFHGFFTLFWLAMALLLVRVAVNNARNGSILGNNELLRMMFGREMVALGVTDGAMCGATVFGLLLQRLIVNDFLNWNTSGWIIQNLWQTFYLGAIVGWTFYREWPWTHTIFIVLHGLVFLMKQHSYAFYNGYLSQVYKRKKALQRKLEQLNSMSPMVSPVSTPKPSSPVAANEFESNLRHRRNRSIPGSTSGGNMTVEDSEIASVASTISSGKALDSEQMVAFSRIISSELDAIETELKGKCTITENYYPFNLTLFNWAEWTCLPTLVYELEYPRQDKINWWYVAEKTGAVFGVLTVMQVISQAYIYPAVSEAVRMKAQGMTLDERWQEFPYLLLDMLFPLLLEQLLTWYLIWECVLNVLAELTGFADRGFYGEWWNAISWDQYARDWNRPVHNFLLRHVYHSSISSFKMSKASATFVTFLLSACVHELLMFCLFKKVRGYLFLMQLLQLPLVALSRTKPLKGRKVLGNLVFWIGLFVGPAFLTSLYLVI